MADGLRPGEAVDPEPIPRIALVEEETLPRRGVETRDPIRPSRRGRIVVAQPWRASGRTEPPRGLRPEVQAELRGRGTRLRQDRSPDELGGDAGAKAVPSRTGRPLTCSSPLDACRALGGSPWVPAERILTP